MASRSLSRCLLLCLLLCLHLQLQLRLHLRLWRLPAGKLFRPRMNSAQGSSLAWLWQVLSHLDEWPLEAVIAFKCTHWSYHECLAGCTVCRLARVSGDHMRSLSNWSVDHPWLILIRAEDKACTALQRVKLNEWQWISYYNILLSQFNQ